MPFSPSLKSGLQHGSIAKQSYSFCTDGRLRINSWDGKIAGLTGRPSYTVLGKKYFEVLPRIFVEGKDALAAALKEDRKLSFKKYCLNCLHGRIDADIKISPLKDADGKVVKVKVVISPYSTCLMAVKFQNLQRLVDIGKTASTLAHGVRNPLNAIKGAVVHLREKYADEQILIEFTKIMEDEVMRLDNFISRFLSASISDAELSALDINAQLKRMEVFTSMQTHACSIVTVYEYGDIPPVTIDAFQFEQAVLNIINNAIEAMESGGQLTVRTLPEKRFGTDFAVIEISDTGPGIAESRMNAVSAPLGERGKGFGLFITREILQYFKGHMEITSKKDAGAVIKLYFPADRERS
ncbi:MAG: ATP-binding protein [Nitrospirae bacterium]|nr:ATP-binding protein [Nitrospirota bacterium]